MAAVLATVWFTAALVMVPWPAPHFTRSLAGVTGNDTEAGGASSHTLVGEMDQFRMRDGAVLQARRFASDAPLIVLYLHGVMSSSRECLEICRQIRDVTGAEVFALDLRGHGESDGAPGDIHYIGQYEDDVADVMAALRHRKPGSQIILAGHSMGGGIAMRYAGTRKVPIADGYLLFAPRPGIKSLRCARNRRPARRLRAKP